MSNPLRLAALLLVATFAACGRQEATEPPPGVAAPADQPAPVASSASLLPPEQQLARDILEQLIEIDTTDSHGDNTAAAQAMADRLLAAGFPPEDVQVLGPVERKGNLVARLRGRDSGRKPLLLLAHIDVVAADPADWTLDPFTFIEQDGYFYGRGTSDDKDEAAIHIANLIRMKQEGYQPDRDIIVALTADEEGGEHNGVDWLLKNHPGLIDAAYALNEGGGGALKDGQMCGGFRDHRHCLNAGRTGANLSHALAAKIHAIVRPLARVVPAAPERIASRNVRYIRRGQAADRGDQELHAIAIAIVGGDDPAIARRIVDRGRDAGVEPDVALEVELVGHKV